MTRDADRAAAAPEEAVARAPYHADGPVGAARDDLLDRCAALRAGLDDLLETAEAAGWTVPAFLRDGLRLRLAALAELIEEEP